MKWTEKYRPSNLDAIEGKTDDKTDLKNELIKWGNTFYDSIPKTEKAILLHGGAGVGKTSSAFALVGSFGWEMHEINASDSRTGDELRESLLPVVLSSTINSIEFSERKLILIDEVDNLYTNEGKKDNSAEKELVNIIEKSKNPLVLTCNNLYGVPKGIRDICKVIGLKGVYKPTIKKVMNQIAVAEGFKKVDQETLNNIMITGDMRTSISNLQAYLTSEGEIQNANYRKLGIFNMLDELFAATKPNDVSDLIARCEDDPEKCIHFIEENMSKHLTPLELYLAYQAISDADVYLKNAKTYNNYAYWGRASKCMTSGVVAARMYPPRGFNRNNPNKGSGYLKKMSGSKYTRNAMKSLALKMAPLYHTNWKSFMINDFPIIQNEIVENNDTMLVTRYAVGCDLNEREVALLLNVNYKDIRVKQIMDANSRVTKKLEKTVETNSKQGKSLLSYMM